MPVPERSSVDPFHVSKSETRYHVLIEHPDDPCSVFDTWQTDEPCVIVCSNADEADAWIQDHESVEERRAEVERLREAVEDARQFALLAPADAVPNFGALAARMSRALNAS